MILQEILRRLLSEYEDRRNSEELRSAAAAKKLYENLPGLKLLEANYTRTNLSLLRDLAFHQENEEEVQQQLDQLEKDFLMKKTEILKAAGYKDDPREIQAHCSLCKDHGYTDDGMCLCLKQKLAQKIFEAEYDRGRGQSSLSQMSFSIYSQNKEKNGKSQRDNIRQIVKSLKNFVGNFDKEQGVNMVFSGSVSQGKTYLATALALELISEGRLVIYQTAPSLLDRLRDFSWRYNEDHAAMKKMVYDCDFLILDDLGKETRSEFSEKELFHLINMRYTAGKSTLISTNLSYDELAKRYGDAFFTRLMENCYLPEFFGPDLRIGG